MTADKTLPESVNLPKQVLLCFLMLNAVAVFGIWLALFVSKWFPGLPFMAVVREWLYRFF